MLGVEIRPYMVLNLTSCKVTTLHPSSDYCNALCSTHLSLLLAGLTDVCLGAGNSQKIGHGLYGCGA
jgi:hypothetical protein